MVFTSNEIPHHSFVTGIPGKGKSVMTEHARVKARLEGNLLVDIEMFREGRGLKPYEHEFARRLDHNLHGRLPRELRGKPVTIIRNS